MSTSGFYWHEGVILYYYMDDHHDHAQATHNAKCDEEGCTYVAMTHAHDEEGAATSLSEELALHNKDEHGVETNPDDIKEAVRGKMQPHVSEVV